MENLKRNLNNIIISYIIAVLILTVWHICNTGDDIIL